MANIRVVKDNTMPPTDCLWRKINAAGEEEGLFAWNGYRWKQIEDASHSSKGTIMFKDSEGNEFPISSLVSSGPSPDPEDPDYNPDITYDTIDILDADGNTLATLVTEEQLKQLILEINSQLYWIEDVIEEEITE